MCQGHAHAADAPVFALLHSEPDGVCVFVSGCVCVCVCVHMYVSTTVCVQDKVLPAALEVSHLFLSDHVDMLANKKQDNTVLS